MFYFLGWEACGILASWPEVEPTPPALEGKVSTTGPPGKSPIYQFLFIYLSAGGHLCCSHFGAIIIIWLWTSIYKFLQGHCFQFSWYVPRNGLAGSYLCLCLTLRETAIPIAKFYFYQHYMKIPISPYPNTNTFCIHLSDSSHPIGCEMVSYCNFDLHFRNG